MNNKELDEILNEIKQHSQHKDDFQAVSKPASQGNEKSEDASAVRNDTEDSDLIDLPAPTKSKSEFSFAPSDEETKEANGIVNNEDKELGSDSDDLLMKDYQYFDDEYPEETKKSKKPLIITIAVILIIAIGVGVYFGFFHKKDEVTTTAVETTQEVTEYVPNTKNNPLTGESDFDAAAIGKRPVAVVVENEYDTASVKPQWGMNEADIVLEGESEYSTRMLLFWADYTDLPAQIGPARSARPPFIHFSQLFDSIFIHAGLSRTRGAYIGANTVFKNEKIDHINLLAYGEDGTYFGRDKSRTETIEHTGYFNGTSAPELIEKQNFETDIDSSKFSILQFNKTPQKLSDKAATSCKFVWSDSNTVGHCPKVGSYYYDETAEKYTTNDFDSDFGSANLQFENLIFLLDTTEYITKENYQGKGINEIYCDYKLTGGTGAVLSQGTVVDITWGVEDGKLWMKDTDGNNVMLNPGKSYIGYGSSNMGGSITIE